MYAPQLTSRFILESPEDDVARISDEQFAQIQDDEWRWWTFNALYDNYDHRIDCWPIYDRHFQPYLLPEFRAVADVGSGPMPYILNPIIIANERVAIDPLFDRYMKVNRFHELLEQLSGHFLDIAEAPSNYFDGVFCQNCLDHVQDPDLMLAELHRIIAPGGRLYFYVDVGRPPDVMHTYLLDKDKLIADLEVLFKPLLCDVGLSWKGDVGHPWGNEVLWFVGGRR